MPPIEHMTDDQLEELLQGCYCSMKNLTVGSKIPAKNRREYEAYWDSANAIEDEQNRRAKAHPSIAEQDTTHSIW